MRNHVRLLPLRFGQSLIVLFLSGCAAGGTTFEKPTPPAANQAIVCLYRPADLYGAFGSKHIMDNGQEITTLANGQFRALSISVGHHELRDARSNSVIFDAVAGETYYFRLGEVHGTFNNSISTSTFMRAYPDDAQNELRSCCKSGSDSP